jgi:hypothetical protein
MNINDNLQKLTIKQHLTIEFALFLVIVCLLFIIFNRVNIDSEVFLKESELKISFSSDKGLVIADINGDVISASKEHVNGDSLKQLKTLAIAAIEDDDEKSNDDKTSFFDKMISPAVASNPHHKYVNIYTETSEGSTCTRYDKFYHPRKPVGPCG